MRKIRQHLPMSMLIAGLMLILTASSPAEAHQPYFEEKDTTVDTPWQIDDPTISLALYFTLESAGDVDYAAFEGRQGQRVLLGITIPQIEGQENFAPTLALMGSGLDAAVLPARIEKPAGVGAVVMPAPPGPAKTFFEPFSRTSYWERQEQYVTLPADGRYVVAVWHPEGQVGRYTLVVGDKERPGGDLTFPIKLRRFWTHVSDASEPVPDSSLAWLREIGSWLSSLVR